MRLDLGWAGDDRFVDQYDFISFFGDSEKGFTDRGGLVVLTDDVGGLDDERKAAGLALKTMAGGYRRKNRTETIPQALRRSLDEANRAVVEAAKRSKRHGAIGVSLVAAVVDRRALYWRSVGDSRLYCLRNGELIQLTSDHTVARQLRLRNLMEQKGGEELVGCVDPEALTCYLGMDSIPLSDANIKPFELDPGDRLLFCSHEVYRAVTDRRIVDSLALEAQSAAETLARIARGKGFGDEGSVTVAVIAVPGRNGAAKFGIPAIRVRQGQNKYIVLVMILVVITLAFVTTAVFLYRDQSRDEPSASVASSAPALPLQYRDLKPNH